jgi:hypothetical protein
MNCKFFYQGIFTLLSLVACISLSLLTYKRANLAGNFDLDRTHKSIQQPKFLRSPSISLPPPRPLNYSTPLITLLLPASRGLHFDLRSHGSTCLLLVVLSLLQDGCPHIPQIRHCLGFFFFTQRVKTHRFPLKKPPTFYSQKQKRRKERTDKQGAYNPPSQFKLKTQHQILQATQGHNLPT